MGFSNFVGSILSGGRSARPAADPSPPAAEPPSPSSLHTPRRRRGAARADRDRADRPRGPAYSRPGAALPAHSRFAQPTYWSAAEQPAHAHSADWEKKLQLDPDFEDSYGLLAEASVSSRGRRGWRRARNASRVKSNLEDSFRLREPRTHRSREFQRAPAAVHATSQENSHVFAAQYGMQHRPQPRAFSRDPADGPPSLKKLLMRAGMSNGGAGMQQESSFAAKPKHNLQNFGGAHEPHRRPHYHKTGRIRSNLDQFMRRDKDGSGEKRIQQPASGRRRHSLIADAPLHPHDIDHEPISLINESMHAGHIPLADEHPFPKQASPPPRFTTAKPPKSTAKSVSKSLAKQLVRPVVATKVTKGKGSLSSSTSSASTGSSSSTTSSSPLQVRPPTKISPLPPRPPEHLLDLDPDDEEEEDDAPRSLGRQFADAQTAGHNIRFSADAAYPVRRKEAPKFARSHSNPQPPTQEPAVPKQKKRPPPLRTPTDDATGFACGVGLNSGIRRVPLGRTSRDSIEEVVQKDFRNSSTVTLESSENRSTKSPSPVPIIEPKASVSPPDIQKPSPAETKENSRFDIWSPEHSNNGSSGSFGSRFSRKGIDREQDEFLFEEASQSSFGDADSPSRRLTRNGLLSAPGRREIAEVQEDQFVFGADGSFNDGGFIISSNGLVEAPERLMRKTSDGVAVEGVPTSSNNIIFVKSLDEFRKSYTFRSSSKDGTSTLGRGSAGRVYLAIHGPTGRKIAVKEINVYDEEKRKQLRKELQTLINHQSRFLVRSFGAFYDGAGVVHVTLEFMDRGSLADIVLQRGRIPEPVVCKLMEHCLRGLAFLHENHILHRDVKTANILLSRKLCRAKLSDFGLARDFETDNKSKTDSFVGTLAYMSPERLHGRIYTYASDIWSLGITIMECVMGKYPFDKPKSYFDIIDAAQSDPAFLVQNEEVSKECLDFIRQCLQPDMGDRPTARELLQHDWIKSRKDDANLLREWLDTIPRLHCEDVEVGSELAFNAKAKQRARIRAKAQNFL